MLIVLCRVLTRCNYACAFCAHDRRLPGARPALDAHALTQLLDLLGDWHAHTGRTVLLSWLGGEPLLWRERPAFDRRARAAGLRLSLTSNGSLLGQPAVRQQLLAHYAELTVSLDAPAARHDALRGVPGSWQRAVDGLAALLAERRRQDAALKLRINSVLMRSTIAGYGDLLQTLLDALPGIDEFSFNLLGGRDRPAFHALQSVLPEQWQALLAALPGWRAQLAASGARLLGSGQYLERLDAQVQSKPWNVTDCGPGQDFLFVDEAGRIAPCSFTSAEYGVPISSLRHWTQLLALPAHFAARRAQRCAGICAHCPSTQVAGKFLITTAETAPEAAVATVPRPTREESYG